MKLNEHTALSTPSILLVPYSNHHVPTYHEWMQDPDLQAATASEPLSMDEEYAMQSSWRLDSDKLTFIICAPLAALENPDQQPAIKKVEVGTDDASEKMIGDINLFLFRPDSEETEEDVHNLGGNCIGEVELMIALTALRRKGYGRYALLVFLDYILSNWPSIATEYAQTESGGANEGKQVPVPQLGFLRVKVNQTNAGSIRLFESVGFVRTVEEANYFGEVELRWLPDLEGLRKQSGWQRMVELEFREP